MKTNAEMSFEIKRVVTRHYIYKDRDFVIFEMSINGVDENYAQNHRYGAYEISKLEKGCLPKGTSMFRVHSSASVTNTMKDIQLGVDCDELQAMGIDKLVAFIMISDGCTEDEALAKIPTEMKEQYNIKHS